MAFSRYHCKNFKGGGAVKVYITNIGYVQFLVIEDVFSIPTISIKKIDLQAENGGASANSVCVYFDDDKFYLTYESADAFRKFLLDNEQLDY